MIICHFFEVARKVVQYPVFRFELGTDDLVDKSDQSRRIDSVEKKFTEVVVTSLQVSLNRQSISVLIMPVKPVTVLQM